MYIPMNLQVGWGLLPSTLDPKMLGSGLRFQGFSGRKFWSGGWRMGLRSRRLGSSSG